MRVFTKRYIVHIYEELEFDEQLRTEVETTEYDLLSSDNFEKAFDLLTADVRLIVISAETLTKAMADFFKHLKSSDFSQLPLLAIVKTKENISTKNIMKLGYNDYISKENPPAIIVKQIVEFLDKRYTLRKELPLVSVCIIDDDVLHNQLIRRALENKGITNITIFKSGEDFFNQPLNCDVYMVDIVMQRISGIKVVQLIRELHPEAFIVVVSSVAEDKLVTTALMKGADDFIKKPINFEIVFAKMLVRLK